jgi:hypothetical protein
LEGVYGGFDFGLRWIEWEIAVKRMKSIGRVGCVTVSIAVFEFGVVIVWVGVVEWLYVGEEK